MSGGSYDYKYYDVDDYYNGKMFDDELNEMINDLVNLLHDLEWWQSCDYGEEDYRKTVTEFKKKWFRRDEVKIKAVIDAAFEKKKQELYTSLKYFEEDTPRKYLDEVLTECDPKLTKCDYCGGRLYENYNCSKCGREM